MFLIIIKKKIFMNYIMKPSAQRLNVSVTVVGCISTCNNELFYLFAPAIKFNVLCYVT